MSRNPRTWRAVASYRLGPGIPPVVVGRCYRATREGLQAFIDEHEASGRTVSVWQVQTIAEVDAAAQVDTLTRG